MKKFIGIICVAIAAIAMFFTPKSSSNSDLAETISLSILQAEAGNPNCSDDDGDTCDVYGTTIQDCDEHWLLNDCKDGSS